MRLKTVLLGLSPWLALPGPALAQTADAMIERARLQLGRSGCTAADDPDTIVVCAHVASRYRLPLAREAEPAVEAVRGSGLAALAPPAPCGIFAGQRRCGKAEAAGYGYGGGRDPITVAGRLLGIVDVPVTPPAGR